MSEIASDFEAAARAQLSQLELTHRQAEPRLWAQCMATLGEIAHELGRCPAALEALEQARSSFESAAEEYTQLRLARHASAARCRAAAASALLADRRGDARTTDENLNLCRMELAELHTEQSPRRWAKCELALAHALAVTGRRLEDRERLRESLQRLRTVQRAQPADCFPYEWGRVQQRITELEVIIESL